MAQIDRLVVSLAGGQSGTAVLGGDGSVADGTAPPAPAVGAEKDAAPAER